MHLLAGIVALSIFWAVQANHLNCNGFCENTNACTCDNLTGVMTFDCKKADDPALGYVERPVLIDGVYNCLPYDCAGNCANFVGPNFDETPVANAGCYGDGTINSQGTCRCDQIGTIVSNHFSIYTGGQYLKTDIKSEFGYWKECADVKCTDCDNPGQQCQHTIFAQSGSCVSTTTTEATRVDFDSSKFSDTPAMLIKTIADVFLFHFGLPFAMIFQ